MQAVVFIGIQATGKSAFYRERFFTTHARISLDLLHTRHRESVFLRACLDTQQPFVVDNTNPTAEERARYITPARAARFTVTGYYFESKVSDALERNRRREDAQRVPDQGILGTCKRLQLPQMSEGFDALYHVRLGGDGSFIVTTWLADEIR
jgi:predicted kinase